MTGASRAPRRRSACDSRCCAWCGKRRGSVGGLPADREGCRARRGPIGLELHPGGGDGCSLREHRRRRNPFYRLIRLVVDELEVRTVRRYGPARRFLGIVRRRGDGDVEHCWRGGGGFRTGTRWLVIPVDTSMIAANAPLSAAHGLLRDGLPIVQTSRFHFDRASSRRRPYARSVNHANGLARATANVVSSSSRARITSARAGSTPRRWRQCADLLELPAVALEPGPTQRRGGRATGPSTDEQETVRLELTNPC